MSLSETKRILADEPTRIALSSEKDIECEPAPDYVEQRRGQMVIRKKSVFFHFFFIFFFVQTSYKTYWIISTRSKTTTVIKS